MAPPRARSSSDAGAARPPPVGAPAASVPAAGIDGRLRLLAGLPARVTSRCLAGVPFSRCYAVSRVLGAGSMSTVFECADKLTGEAVAVKLIPERAEDPLAALREAAVLSRASGVPTVPALREVLADGLGWCLVTDLAEGRELPQAGEGGRLAEDVAREAMRQLLGCLGELHALGVVHRDVKPENILLADAPAGPPALRLVDFGLAAELPPEGLREVCGTPHYIAPELLRGWRSYGSACDLWSAGVCLYAMLSGGLPFPQLEPPSLFLAIMTGGYGFGAPAWDRVSVDAKDLVMRLLDTDPAERLTAAGALRHRWFSG